MNLSAESAAALIMGGMALIASIVTFVGSAKKNDVDALSEIIDKLRERIEDLEGMNADLENWAERLCCQVRAKGLEPEKFLRNNAHRPMPRKTRPVKFPRSEE